MHYAHPDTWVDEALQTDARTVVERVSGLLSAIGARVDAGNLSADPHFPAALQDAGRFLASALPSLRLYLLACDSCLEVAGDAAAVGVIGQCGSERCQDIEAVLDLKNLLLYGPRRFVDYDLQLGTALRRTERVIRWLRWQLSVDDSLRWSLRHAGGHTPLPARTQHLLDELHYRLARESLGLDDAGPAKPLPAPHFRTGLQPTA